MQKEENKNNNECLDYIINKKAKILLLVILIIIGNNVSNSKKLLIKNNKRRVFKSLVKFNDSKPLIFKKNRNIKDTISENYLLLKQELKNKNLSEINKKRNFDLRYPLPKEIKCIEHLKEGGLIDMMAFTSFLSKDNIFFEFASGCSSIIAKYYSKKSYAVEGNIKWYNIGVNRGLKDNLLFKDLKCDGTGPLSSWPGKNSTIEDWKNFIQAYKKEYNADVIFVDGRFRVACIFDVFNKISNNTIILLHECHRSEYSVIKDYYNLVYRWGSLCLFQKKSNLSEIPLEIQKKYWNEKV